MSKGFSFSSRTESCCIARRFVQGCHDGNFGDLNFFDDELSDAVVLVDDKVIVGVIEKNNTDVAPVILVNDSSHDVDSVLECES